MKNPFDEIIDPLALTKEDKEKGVRKVETANGKVMHLGPAGTKYDDPNATPGSIELADPLKEDYCTRVVLEPHVARIEIYREIFPDKKHSNQSHNQFKNGKLVAERLQYLQRKAAAKTADTVDQTFYQLTTSRDTLYRQAHDNSGNVKCQKTLKLYLSVVDTLNKMHGTYNHTQEHKVDVQENLTGAKDQLSAMLDAKLDGMLKGDS